MVNRGAPQPYKGVSMKRTIALVVAALLIAGCSSKDKQVQTSSPVEGPSDLSITTVFTPDPPQKGADVLNITVKDGRGALVKGATVKVDTTMPSMSMSGPSVTARDNGDGTYSARLALQFATRWEFAISAKSNGKSGVAHVTAEVK